MQKQIRISYFSPAVPSGNPLDKLCLVELTEY